MREIEALCEEMLTTWCESLLSLQAPDGSLECPACGISHGRCFDAMYPFLFLYCTTEDEKWRKAAMNLFHWAERNVSQEDGSYWNDTSSTWTGITVFSLIQMLDSLISFGDLLDDRDRAIVTGRARRAADYLFDFDDLKTRNINYPIANSLAMYLAYLYYRDEKYLAKSDEYVAVWKDCLTPNLLIYGEGRPREARTTKGNAPIDIGYNLEESLPSMIRLGLLSKNEALVELGERSLTAHLMFFLSDGGIDNGFGSRSFKWTYYGSRTSDGMAAAFLMLKDRNPAFGRAALLNLKLQKACTVNGLLSGGPAYGAAGQKPCVHHSFTHTKVLAYILQEGLCTDSSVGEPEFPRYALDGIHAFPELSTSIVSHSGYTATITANDWIYLPEGHPSGGSVTLLQHREAGVLLVSSMNDYVLQEKNNMQRPLGVGHHECLTSRIEIDEKGTIYTSTYDFSATMTQTSRFGISVNGVLTSRAGEQAYPYSFAYVLGDDGLTMTAEYGEGILVLPVVVEQKDIVSTFPGEISIQRNGWRIRIRPGDYVLPYQMERVFHLIPGFQAIRIDCRPIDKKTTIRIKVERI